MNHKIQRLSFALIFLAVGPLSFPRMSFGQSAQDSAAQFKKAAWRAIDAIGRTDEYLNDDRMGNTVNEKTRITDAEKAADEVKYIASSDSEKHLAAILIQGATEEVNMSRLDLSDANWRQHKAREEQCLAEAKLQIASDEMTPKEKESAPKQTCLKEEAWNIKP